MLASSLALSELSVCAQCQYRLFFRRQRLQRRLCQIPYWGLRPFTARHASTAVDPGSNASQDLLVDPKETDHSVWRPIEDYNPLAEGYEATRELSGRRPSRNAPPTPMWDPYKTLNMEDGHSVIRHSPHGNNSERHTIDHKVLGEPAEVVVLPSDAQPTRPTPLPASTKKDETWRDNVQLSGPEMLAQIARERGIVGEETWFANMESVKTELLGKHGTSVRREEYFRDMSDSLYNGFTKRQLRTYIDTTMEAKATDEDINDLDFSMVSARKNITRTAWFTVDERPVVPNLSEKTTGADRTREKSMKFLDKNVLADYIVRRVWNVRIQSNEGNNGKIGIRLKPIAFDLIVNHRDNFLKGFADTYGVKIEAVRSLKIIWVTSDLEGCKDVWKSLCSMAEGVQRKKIRYNFMDGHAKTPKKIEQDVLNEIGKLTGTKLTPLAGQQLDVHYLGPSENDLRDAQKMLVAFAAPDTSTDRRVVWKCGKLQPVLASVNPSDHVAIRHRSNHWSRWSSSSLTKPLPSSGVAEEPQVGNEEVVKSIAESMCRQTKARPRRQRDQSDGSAIWTPQPAYVSRATIGQIIHPVASDSKSSHRTVKQPIVADAGSQLLTVVSGMRRPLSNFEVQASNAETLQITLSPTSPPHLRKYLPTLQLIFNLDSSAQMTSLSSCQLITSASEVDVLMPERSVDVRVSNTSHLDVSSISKLDATISSFITASNLDIWHGDQRLSTPNGLKLHLPGHALNVNNVSQARESTNDQKPVSGSNHEYEGEKGPKPTSAKPKRVDPKILQEGVEADYTFTGLEHRSTITFSYEEGTELRYSIVEAGRIGGRREELSVVLKDEVAHVHSSERAKTLWQGAERLIKEIEGVNDV